MDDAQLRKYVELRRRSGVKPAPVQPVRPKVKNPFGLTAPTGVTVTGPPVNPLRGKSPAEIRRENQHRVQAFQRQRELRAAGFQIAVDGIWGPRSQKAWLQYKKQGRTSVVFKDNVQQDMNTTIPFTLQSDREKKAEQEAIRQGKEDAAAAKIQQEQQKKAARQRQLAAERAAILKRANELRANPASAARLPITSLTRIMLDPHTNFNPAKNRQAALALQYNLRAKGYKDVDLTGVFDQKTFTTLKTAFKTAAKREHDKRLAAIKDEIYGPLNLRPGQAPPEGFPLDKVPTPEEFDKIIQGGGFTASRLLYWSQNRVANDTAAFQAAALGQIKVIARDLQPFLMSGKLGDINLLQALGAIYGADLSGDLFRKDVKPGDMLSEMDKRNKRKEVLMAHNRNQLFLRDDILRMMRSRSPKDFAQKAAKYEQLSQFKWSRMQADLAHSDPGFFGKALEYIFKPGEYLTASIALAEMVGIQKVDRLFGGAEGRDIQWEDALAAWGREVPVDYDGMVTAANGIARFVLGTAADPLNFVGPLRIGSTAARILGGSRRLGYYGRFEGGSVWKSGIRYNKGTWSKAEQISKIPGAYAIGQTALMKRAAALGNQLTALKEDRMRAVSQRLLVLSHNAFRKPNHPAVDKDFANVVPVNIDDVNKSRNQIIQMMNSEEYDDVFGGLRQEIVGSLASLYGHVSRDGGLSSVGASVLANGAEDARIAAAHRIGTETVEKLLDETGYEALVKEYRTLQAKKVAPGSAQKAKAIKLGQLRDELDAIISRIGAAYDAAMEDAGAFIIGGVGDVATGQRIYNYTLTQMDVLEDVVFPSLQDMVQQHADEVLATARAAAKEGGEHLRPPVRDPLWDEDGRWAGRNGEQANALRERAARSFDEENLVEVRNPAWDRPYTQAEAMRAMDFELRRAIPRIQHFAAREQLRLGDDYTFDMKAALDRERDKIKKGWRIGNDGKWYDTREMIKVSRLYARNFRESFVSKREILKEILDPDTGEALATGLQRLALPPSHAYEDPLQAAVGTLMWNIGARFRNIKGPGSKAVNEALVQSSPSRRFKGLVPPAELEGEELGKWWEEEIDRLSRIGELFSTHKIDLANAADSLMTGELMKERLYIAALSKAQGRYAQALYNVIYWSTRAWIFSTLPLRQGWVVRNTLDNFAKSMIEAVRDPRVIFLGAEHPGRATKHVYDGIHNIFQVGITPLRGAIRLMDGLFGSKTLEAFDELLEQFWEFPVDVVRKVFESAAVDGPPPAVLDGARFSQQLDNWRGDPSARPIKPTVSDYEKAGRFGEIPKDLSKAEKRRELKELVEENGSWVDKLHFKMRYEKSDTMWELMANRPENYWKRVIYRAEVKKKTEELTKIARAESNTRLLRGEVARYPVRFDIDEEALEYHVIDKLKLPPDKHVDVKVLSPGEWTDLNELYGGIPGSEGVDLNFQMRGVFEPLSDNYGRLAIVVPEVRTFTSKEGLDKFMNQIAEAIEHEMRHAVQWTKWIDRKLAPLDYKLPYWWQMREIEARFFGKRKKDLALAHSIANPRQEDVNLLPDSLIDKVEIAAQAHAHAWDVVTNTLFDYSKISVIEDNLRVFFPFIQFWRKNTALWGKYLTTKPWLPVGIAHFDMERRNSHRDLPQWMQRYIHVDEIVDAAAVVPGLAPVVEAMLPDNAMIDPMSFLSFAPLHRAWRDFAYGDNANLPSQEKGMRIIGPMIDAMNDWGLGMSPYVRKPLEGIGVADARSWQRVFPQTSLAIAFSTKFFNDEVTKWVADWERVFDFGLGKAPSQAIAENFDFYVNQEMAGQVAGGKFVSRQVAEDTIKAWLWTQQLWGYFGGTYWRRATPEDIYMSKLQDEVRTSKIDYNSLTDKEKHLLKLWSMRGYSPEAFDRYLVIAPAIKAFYKEPEAAARAEMIQQVPGLANAVGLDPPQRKGIGQTWIRDVAKYTDSQRFFLAMDLAKAIDAPSDIKSAAYDIFAPQELREFWARNDTPAQVKDRMVQAEVFRYMKDLNTAYHKIPETDYEARDGFIAANPELVRYWNHFHQPSDAYDAVISKGKATLRDLYFNVLETQGFEAAAPILKQFPFMFEGTASEKKIKDGEWIGGSKKGWSKDRREAWGKVASFAKWFFDVYMKKVGEDKAWEWLRKSQEAKARLLVAYLDKYGKHNTTWSAERKHLFLEAKPYLKWFFEVFMPKVGEKKAWAWLEKADGEGAKLIKEYLRKYGKKSQKRIDYMKAKPYLEKWSKMEGDAKYAWLNGDSEGAKIVRWFFDKYADRDSQHAKDYLAVKSLLDKYGKMTKEQRRAWLDAKSPEALKVLAFFKKYGKDHQYERAFKKFVKKYPGLTHGTPEQADRIRFWIEYFHLTPDKRPAFVHEHAEDAGIFIYGDFSEQYRHDQEAEFKRRAVGLDISERAAAYIYVRPLLQFYRTLDTEDRPLFLRANPELQEYFDKYVKKSLTGNKRLDGLVAAYFRLPDGSRDRSEFLRKHPEVQIYFDKKASPAERAMRSVLTQYFEIRDPNQRDEFMIQHPEIQEYFDRRREERDIQKMNLEAFDDSDPRLRPFYDNAADLVRAAERERERLRRGALRRLQPDELLNRRDRIPLADRT